MRAADRSLSASPARTETLSSAVYESLRERILSGQYALGVPLSRRRLAEEFATSLVPIAEALQKLEIEGFVESQPRVGTRVKSPSVSEIRGSYAVREALESQAARMFCEMASERDKRVLIRLARRLDAMALRMDRRLGGRMSLEFDRAHLAFHMKIAECSGCRELVEAIKQSRILLFNWLFGVSAQLPPVPADWHQQLARALTSGDVQAADAGMRRHVRYRFDEIMARVSTLAESPQKIVRGPRRRQASA